jgi:hypothetical protein
MANYMNPFGMMPNSQELGGPTSSLGMANAIGRENLSMPFIQMAQQQQGMQTQEQAMKLQEMQSPLAVQARQAALQKQQAQDQAATILAPEKLKMDLAQVTADLKSLPAMTEEKIEKAKSAAMEAKGKPAANLINQLGDLEGALEKAPEGSRPMLYQHIIKQWQEMNPGAQLPRSLQQYNPEALKTLRFMKLHSIEQEQKLAAQAQKDVAAQRRTETTAGATVRAAEIAAEATKERGAAAETPAKAIARLQRELRQDPTNQEAQAELQGLVANEWSKSKQNDAGLMILEMQAIQGDQAARQQYEAEYTRKYNRFLKERNITSGTPSVGRSDVERAGWPYEPDKYNYRVGPNGRLQRSPKG